MKIEKRINTDVLIIGGGIAGCFTAIKAKEQGVNVLIIDKGYVGKTSGIRSFPGDIQVFNPARGHKINAWLEQINRGGEYLNNQKWTEIVLKESLDRYKDLVSWGVDFYQSGGKIAAISMGVLEHFSMVSGKYFPAFRKKALDSGVKIMDRLMACELLKQDGKIIGAIGFHTITGVLYVFQAKATVVATGGSSVKLGHKPINYWTADGESMAYRAGAEITGKEFTVAPMMAFRSITESPAKDAEPLEGTWKEVDSMTQFPRFGYALMSPIKPIHNAEGGPVTNPAWEAHSGRIPLYGYVQNLNPSQQNYIRHVYQNQVTKELDEIGSEIYKGDKLKFKLGSIDDLVNVFGGSGIWPIDMECNSGLPGLYAVGNACGTWASGAAYAGLGFGLCHCAVTATKAAHGAAVYSAKLKNIRLAETCSNRLKKIVTAPMNRSGGFSPGWVTQLVQSIIVPYYVLQVKHANRLKAALTNIEFVNNQIVPKIMARDAHEWRMAQETKNMALDAEMRLRASLYRTESRATHFREDYPYRDDPTWLVWIKVKKDEQGKMIVIKDPIPKKWWPDLKEPYEKRYAYMYPEK